jgi:hypothetical protein
MIHNSPRQGRLLESPRTRVIDKGPDGIGQGLWPPLRNMVTREHAVTFLHEMSYFSQLHEDKIAPGRGTISQDVKATRVTKAMLYVIARFITRRSDS